MAARLRSLIRKELLQTGRDLPIIVLVLYTFAEIVLCGWSLTMDVRHIPTALVDRDRSRTSRALADRFLQADAFAVAMRPADEQALQQAMDDGRVSLGIVIPAGLERDLARGAGTAVQVLVDGTQANTALVTLGYVDQIVAGFAQNLRADPAGSIDPGLPRVVERIRSWYVPGLTFIHFNMVAMVSIAVVMIGILLAAAGIVREKESGTLEQLMVTPIRPLELVLAKIAPMVILMTIGLAIGIVLSVVVFGVTPAGDPVAGLALFFGLSLLALLSSAGIGVWIATVARNLMQALLLSFFLLFPIMFLSGTLTPVKSTPDWLQTISYASPMRHYLALALQVYLKGVGLAEVASHVLPLAVFTLAILAVALRRLRRSLV